MAQYDMYSTEPLTLDQHCKRLAVWAITEDESTRLETLPTWQRELYYRIVQSQRDFAALAERAAQAAGGKL